MKLIQQGHYHSSLNESSQYQIFWHWASSPATQWFFIKCYRLAQHDRSEIIANVFLALEYTFYMVKNQFSVWSNIQFWGQSIKSYVGSLSVLNQEQQTISSLPSLLWPHFSLTISIQIVRLHVVCWTVVSGPSLTTYYKINGYQQNWLDFRSQTSLDQYQGVVSISENWLHITLPINLSTLTYPAVFCIIWTCEHFNFKIQQCLPLRLWSWKSSVRQFSWLGMSFICRLKGVLVDVIIKNTSLCVLLPSSQKSSQKLLI